MTIAPGGSDAEEKCTGVSPALRQLAADARATIVRENAALKAERNARRYKAERDPLKYETQKANQREEYAARIADTEGREVRAYCKVPGKTLAEHDENAKARDASRKRAERGNATQAQKDAQADAKWLKRQRARGASEADIAAGLAKRAAGRTVEGEAEGYEANPNFGAF
ncbi:hypothetical protein AL036_16405 [Salipiger aestuarii]|uniref:hypothetical protein n=1 Tax=Salipiger aestuarii TaxID=568098 RepID=UPI00123BE0E4|nr:hypothetical protein [Salipiger aestuarii]KAA8606027.1 hypothetical protein AL036_16405 [Salipiger aestuarii]